MEPVSVPAAPARTPATPDQEPAQASLQTVSMAGQARLLEMTYEVIQRWEIPTQNCVLAHVSTQMEAMRKYAYALECRLALWGIVRQDA